MDLRQTVLVACVHFHDQERVEAFAAHVRSDVTVPDGWTVDIVICDNSLNWDTGAPPDSEEVVRPTSNLGYLNGVAFALGWWVQDRGAIPEWLLICNTDIVLDREFVRELANLGLGLDIGIIAPHITEPGAPGKNLNPHRMKKPSRFKAMRDLFWSLSFTTALLNRVLHRVFDPLASRWHTRRDLGELDGSSIGPVDIYAPHGCCVAVHRNLLLHHDVLHFPGFLYGEEEHLGEVAAVNGLRVTMVPSLRVRHTRDGSIERTVSSRQRRRWSRDANLRILRSHYRNRTGSR